MLPSNTREFNVNLLGNQGLPVSLVRWLSVTVSRNEQTFYLCSRLRWGWYPPSLQTRLSASHVALASTNKRRGRRGGVEDVDETLAVLQIPQGPGHPHHPRVVPVRRPPAPLEVVPRTLCVGPCVRHSRAAAGGRLGALADGAPSTEGGRLRAGRMEGPDVDRREERKVPGGARRGRAAAGGTVAE